MNTSYESSEDHPEVDLYQEIESLVRKNPWAWQSVCAVLGLAGGLFAPVLGAAADVVTWFVRSQSVNSRLHVLSIFSCALMLPLIAFGGFCLDSLQSKALNE